MEKIQDLERSVIVLVEWIPGEFDGWAKIKGAYNVVTGEVMDAGLSPDAVEALQGMSARGTTAGTTTPRGRFTRSYLDDFAKAGVYDRELGTRLRPANRGGAEHREAP